MATALSVTHAFLPPHPGPTVIAQEYGTNVGMVLVYGFIIAIPTVIISGPLFAKVARKLVPSAFEKEPTGSMASIGDAKQYKLEDTPGFGISAFTALFPVILMALSTIITLIQDGMELEGNWFFDTVTMIGSPTTVMLLSVLLAVYTMGVARKIPMQQLMKSAENAVAAIGMMLLILGAGGIIASHVNDTGFWIVKESFDLTMKETFTTWTVLETLI